MKYDVNELQRIVEDYRRVGEVIEDCKMFFENTFTGKIEVNFNEGKIASVNVSIYKKGSRWS